MFYQILSYKRVCRQDIYGIIPAVRNLFFLFRTKKFLVSQKLILSGSDRDLQQRTQSPLFMVTELHVQALTVQAAIGCSLLQHYQNGPALLTKKIIRFIPMKHSEWEIIQKAKNITLPAVQFLIPLNRLFYGDIKEWIMQKGAVEANFYFSESYLNKTSSAYSYYCGEDLTSNHAILIVGWDDYYSKSNFKNDSRPSYPGAFLCKKSWGSDWTLDCLK